MLLTQLTRLDEQVETRERNFTYLAKGLEEIDGVKAFKRDPRVTRWSIYYWNFRYEQDKFDGVPRDRFLEAVEAEGAPIGVGAHRRAHLPEPPVPGNDRRADLADQMPRVPQANRLYPGALPGGGAHL